MNDDVQGMSFLCLQRIERKKERKKESKKGRNEGRKQDRKDERNKLKKQDPSTIPRATKKQRPMDRKESATYLCASLRDV